MVSYAIVQLFLMHLSVLYCVANNTDVNSNKAALYFQIITAPARAVMCDDIKGKQRGTEVLEDCENFVVGQIRCRLL